jgi:hypothetical protein
MMCRPHPVHGWIWLQPEDWRATLQRQIEERDRLDDPQQSGPAPLFLQWVEEQQLPRLAKHPHYQRQFSERVSELELMLSNLQKQIDGGRLDLKPQADEMQQQITKLQELTA